MACGHENSEDTSTHCGGTGLPVKRCLSCDEYFSDEDLVREAMKGAAEDASDKDDGWADRYQRSLSSQGYSILPWPAEMVPLHAGVPTDPRIKPPREGLDMLVVDDDVLRAMVRSLEAIGVMTPVPFRFQEGKA